MILSRRCALISGCSSCRIGLVNHLPSTSGASFRALLQPKDFLLRSGVSKSKRCLVTSSVWRSDYIGRVSDQDTASADDEALNTQPSTDTEESASQPPSVPWYLQVDTPRRTSNPLLERQQIPELPADPPPLLKPLLEHISIDLGLDDLVIFDLRKIDPPPALGAGLLMIIGTARSEKHLHVSADRFCRWLKVTHKLSPFADGLLGRGELKLKLRRKARRARLLSNVGSSEPGNPDDGLRTGWICVNIGTIEDPTSSHKKQTREEGYVGFGEEIGGAKVVVQMLTQEKRDELDLEDLWGKMLRRQERREGRIAPEEVPDAQDEGSLSLHEYPNQLAG